MVVKRGAMIERSVAMIREPEQIIPNSDVILTVTKASTTMNLSISMTCPFGSTLCLV